MQRIDAHQHFWQYDPTRDSWITEDMEKIRRDFLPEDLAPLLKENGVAGCIAVQADQSLAETDFLLQLAARHDFIKGVVGWVDLKSPQLNTTVDHYNTNSGSFLKGFRHILQGEADLNGFLSDGLFEKGLRYILSKGYTYDLLVYHDQLPALQPLVESLSSDGAIKDCKLVLDHMGKPDLKSGEIKNWQQQIRRLASHKNVYCKISGMVTEADWHHWKPDDLRAALDTVLDAFGPERLMFGSDWPVCLVASTYDRWLEVLTQYFQPLSHEQQSAIFGGNCARFYGI